MIHESKINVGSLGPDGSLKDCAMLCPDCPRRTGERKVKAKGISGWLGKKVTERVHYSSLKSGILRSFQTNGVHGVFHGEGADNTGTVTGLNQNTIEEALEAVINCEGTEKGGNVCGALGPMSYDAMVSLDSSVERAIDELPLEDMLATLVTDEATRIKGNALPETEVFVNNSQPNSSI
ncbi:MAG TPA: hypothetical protein VK534_02445 [Methylomirabilota bacterium]|nr:hypothetical protein [Methylomirabilota bacterium]